MTNHVVMFCRALSVAAVSPRSRHWWLLSFFVIDLRQRRVGGLAGFYLRPGHDVKLDPNFHGYW